SSVLSPLRTLSLHDALPILPQDEQLHFIDTQTHFYYIKSHLPLHELHVFYSERTYSAINFTCFIRYYTSFRKTTHHLTRTTHLQDRKSTRLNSSHVSISSAV